MMAPILFVTGKGGTGKSSLAAALARLAASRGRPVVLVRMRPSGEIADGEADVPEATAGSRATARRRGREEVGPVASRGASRHAEAARHHLREVVLDDTRSLEQFLTRVLRLGFLARRLLDSRTFTAVAAAAPGLRDLVTLSVITSIASSRSLARGGLVVVDAPATGHSVPLLTAPSRVLELAPLGPVAREARLARRAIADPVSFKPVLVTIAEEFAITEALSLRRELVAAEVPAPHVVVNGLWPLHVDARGGERIAASGASSDATLHWRRTCRQAELVADLERQVGACARIGFSFHDDTLPPADVDALLHSLVEDAA
jgi:arsenite/tail-anchored protein-transporting ATPase